MGDTDKYSKYCGTYTKEYGSWITSLDIIDMAKNRIKFEFYNFSMAIQTEYTAGWGYFTGENTAEAFGTYKYLNEEYTVKYYFIFGDDYIDFKFELQDDWNEDGSSDVKYTRFKL